MITNIRMFLVFPIYRDHSFECVFLERRNALHSFLTLFCLSPMFNLNMTNLVFGLRAWPMLSSIWQFSIYSDMKTKESNRSLQLESSIFECHQIFHIRDCLSTNNAFILRQLSLEFHSYFGQFINKNDQSQRTWSTFWNGFNSWWLLVCGERKKSKKIRRDLWWRTRNLIFQDRHDLLATLT